MLLEPGDSGTLAVLVDVNPGAPAGSIEILVQASASEEQIITADIEREAIIRARQRFHFARDRRPDAYGAVTQIVEELHR